VSRIFAPGACPRGALTDWAERIGPALWQLSCGCIAQWDLEKPETPSRLVRSGRDALHPPHLAS
jgi:hypothetical protein